MTRRATIRRCPNCCPTGGAECDAAQHAGRPVWRCRNCFQTFPRRVVNAEPGHANATQSRLVERIAELFGVKSGECEMIGRKLWVTFRNDSRSMAAGQLLAGAIGPRGKLELTLYRWGGDAKISSIEAAQVYLRG